MGHVRASAAKGQIICKAKRKVKSASQKIRKNSNRVETCEWIQQWTVGAACKNCKGGGGAGQRFITSFAHSSTPRCAP